MVRREPIEPLDLKRRKKGDNPREDLTLKIGTAGGSSTVGGTSGGVPPGNSRGPGGHPPKQPKPAKPRGAKS